MIDFLVSLALFMPQMFKSIYIWEYSLFVKARKYIVTEIQKKKKSLQHYYYYIIQTKHENSTK